MTLLRRRARGRARCIDCSKFVRKGQRVCPECQVRRIFPVVQANPQATDRQIAKATGLPLAMVRRTLHNVGYR